MAVISKTDTWINTNIKESKIERIQVGYPVIISLDAFPNETFYGEVESISPAAGSEFALIPRNNASGNFIKTEALIPVRIRILDPKNKARMLPGMSATVSIMIDPLNEKDKDVVAYRKLKAEVAARQKKAAKTTESTHSPTSQAAGTAPADAKPGTPDTPKADAGKAAPDKPASDAQSATKPDAKPSQPTNATAQPASDSTPPPPPVAPGTGAENQSPSDTPQTDAPADTSSNTKTSLSQQVQDVARKGDPGSVGTDGR